jgi:hypothetical protein
MPRLVKLTGLAILGFAVAASVSVSGDTKDKDTRLKLPPGWSALMLS